MHIYEQNKLIISGCWLYKWFLFCLFVIYYFKMLTPWKNSYNKSRQCIKKQRIAWSTKIRIVKTMVFRGLMYGCESWTIKKVERQRSDTFELWCWRKLLRVPWTARRSNPSLLKEINHEYSLKDWCWKLKLQYFDHQMWRADSLGKTLMLGKTERKRSGQQRRWHHWLNGY